MECPNCGDKKTSVKETTDLTYQINRKRYCPACHRYFYTVEQLAEVTAIREAYPHGARPKR